MKLLILLISFHLCVGAASAAQVEYPADSNGVKRTKAGEKKNDAVRSSPQSGGMHSTQELMKGFIDENGDGIDDRLQATKGKSQAQHGIQGQHGTQMLHDRFIDMDGDGINDNRCGSMGIAPKNTEVHDNGKHH